MTIKLSVEILDHIFSFLVYHRETLVACSKDPLLFPIVERHLYHQVIVYLGEIPATDEDRLKPTQLAHLIAQNPRFPFYVQSLHLQFGDCSESILNEFAGKLRLFSVLQCFIITTDTRHVRPFPDEFHSALSSCFELPTLEKVVLNSDDIGYFLPFVDGHKNIKHLSLSGRCDQVLGPSSTYPQLNSLSLRIQASEFLPSWLNSHIDNLKSLKYSGSTLLSKVLTICSTTLERLEINAHNYGIQVPNDYYMNRDIRLSKMVIRAGVDVYNGSDAWEDHHSWLPGVYKIMRLTLPPQHLVLDVPIRFLSVPFEFHLNEIDFSPLSTPTFMSVPRIDLYVYTNLSYKVTHEELVSSLERNRRLARLMNEGKLIIHAGEVPQDS